MERCIEHDFVISELKKISNKYFSLTITCSHCPKELEMECSIKELPELGVINPKITFNSDDL